MKGFSKKAIITAALTVLFLISYLIYSRPLTLSRLYPLLTADKCVGINGYYRTSVQKDADLTHFTIEVNSEEFEELYRLFYEKTYRRSLRDLLPRGTRAHQITDKFEFEWEVMFQFDTIDFPDGNAGSGSLLRIQYWYGELDIYNAAQDGDRRFCRTDGQDVWAKEVLALIQ